MSQWANEHPERMAAISALPPSEQPAALRAAMGPAPSGVRCEACRARYGVRGDIRDAQRMPCPNCGGGLSLDY
jgi:hypothetical protein